MQGLVALEKLFDVFLTLSDLALVFLDGAFIRCDALLDLNDNCRVFVG